MNTIVIIGAIVQIGALIVFFIMAYNVMSIKKILLQGKKSITYYIEAAEEEEAVGNTEKAKEYLNRAKYLCNKSEDFYIDGIDSKANILEKIDSQLAKLQN